jgi:Uma2 family endonuclease
MTDEPEPMNVAAAVAEQRVFLSEVSWRTFQLLEREASHSRGRLAYDRGLLEIMAPSYEHDVISRLLALLIYALTDELSLPMQAAGSTTLERFDQQVAVQPDECFFIGAQATRIDRRELDLTRDPPPDLVVEVDISRSSRSRLQIYAAISIPEVWRWNGRELEFLIRQKDGSYAARATSALFPRVAAGDLTIFLQRRHAEDHNAIVRAFRAWVRKRHAGEA